LANLLRPLDDPAFRGLFFGNQGQPILKFAWNAKAKKAYPIFLRDPKNFPPLQFSRLVSNPEKSLIDWHPDFAKKMLRYEIEVLDQANEKDASFDKSKYQSNRMRLNSALDALNQQQRLLERQAKLQENAEAGEYVLKAQIDKPIPEKSDLAIVKEVGKDLRKQKYEEMAIPILKAKLTRERNKAIERGEAPPSTILERRKRIREQEFINAYIQGATGRTGSQKETKDLLAPETAKIIGNIIATSKDLKKEEIIKGEFTGGSPNLRPELQFKAPTLPTKTEQDFKNEQERLTSARNDINNDKFKNEMTGELLSDEEKNELRQMNRNALDRVEHNIKQFQKTPNNRMFAVKDLPEGSGTGTPITPIRLVYEKELAKKRGDTRQVQDLEQRINLVKQQSAVQSSRQIGGEREVSAIFSNKVCMKCAGTGIVLCCVLLCQVHSCSSVAIHSFLHLIVILQSFRS